MDSSPLVASVVGARPQFSKVAVVGSAILKTGRLAHRVIHTGQHYDRNMSKVHFDDLGIAPPEVQLEVGSGSHGEQTAAMLVALEREWTTHRPALVLVYGDTNSTLAAALTAAKMYIPIAHVEAGLRSFNRRMPEEINRVVADRLSQLLFCPSDVAVANLRGEGIVDGVHEVGDVMLDCALAASREVEPGQVAARWDLRSGEYFLATCHRAENTDVRGRLEGVLGMLARAAERAPVLFLLHPRTRAALARHELAVPAGVLVAEPLGYRETLALQRGSAAVLTDSGGMQKEAYFLGVPCITMREETEWVETCQTGWNTLVGVDLGRFVTALTELPTIRRRAHPQLYGDGASGERIAAIVGDYLLGRGASR